MPYIRTYVLSVYIFKETKYLFAQIPDSDKNYLSHE